MKKNRGHFYRHLPESFKFVACGGGGGKDTEFLLGPPLGGGGGISLDV